MWTVLVPVIFAAITWAISVEIRNSRMDSAVDSRISRMESMAESKVSKMESVMETKFSKMDSALDLAQRVKTLEDLVVPMAVEWKVHMEMKKYRDAHPEMSKTAPTPAPKESDLQKHAQNWVDSQMPRNREKK